MVPGSWQKQPQKPGGKGIRPVGDRSVEIGLDLCFQQNVLAGVGCSLKIAKIAEIAKKLVIENRTSTLKGGATGCSIGSTLRQTSPIHAKTARGRGPSGMTLGCSG